MRTIYASFVVIGVILGTTDANAEPALEETIDFLESEFSPHCGYDAAQITPTGRFILNDTYTNEIDEVVETTLIFDIQDIGEIWEGPGKVGIVCTDGGCLSKKIITTSNRDPSKKKHSNFSLSSDSRRCKHSPQVVNGLRHLKVLIGGEGRRNLFNLIWKYIYLR